MPNTRLAVPALCLMLLAAPHAWADPGHGGNAVTPSTTPYGGSPAPQPCTANGLTCDSSGSADLTTGALTASASLERTQPGSGLDDNDRIAYAGQLFLLKRPAKTVVATIVLTSIAPGQAVATSADGVAVADAWVGGWITDSGCASFGCGASTAEDEVQVRLKADIVGQTTKDTTDSTATRTFIVTLSRPDGSDLPKGYVSAAGFVFARGQLSPLSCVSYTYVPQTCTSGTPHTGSAGAAVAATVSQISFRIS